MGRQSLADQILQMIRNLLGSSLSHHLSHLASSPLDPMHASSLGAIAGLAIALFCTWKYLKAPGQLRKRLAKTEDSSSFEPASEQSSSATSSAVALSATQPKQRGALIQEPAVPVQLALWQIVRQQLKGAHKVTCLLQGIILEENSPDELQKHAVVRPAIVDVLLELAKSCDLYLLARVLDDESEANVMRALEAIGLFTVGGLNLNKVLFCSTEAGRNSFVRQLEPDWHIDTSAEILSQLARFVQYELHVSPNRAGFIAPNVFSSDSLEAYFGSVSCKSLS